LLHRTEHNVYLTIHTTLHMLYYYNDRNGIGLAMIYNELHKLLTAYMSQHTLSIIWITITTRVFP